MYQFLVSFTVQPEHPRQRPYFGAFFAEASNYAEGPNWLMHGNLIGDKANAYGIQAAKFWIRIRRSATLHGCCFVARSSLAPRF